MGKTAALQTDGAFSGTVYTLYIYMFPVLYSLSIMLVLRYTQSSTLTHADIDVTINHRLQRCWCAHLPNLNMLCYALTDWLTLMIFSVFILLLLLIVVCKCTNAPNECVRYNKDVYVQHQHYNPAVFDKHIYLLNLHRFFLTAQEFNYSTGHKCI